MEHKHNLSVINELLPVLTSGNTGVWVCNTASGKLDFKNDFFNILGLTRSGVNFSSLDELRTLLHADDIQAFDEAFAAASAGENRTVTYRCNFEGGEALMESTLMPCGDGVVSCTVNKSMMQQLLSWEKQYRTIVNAMFPNFFFVWDENFHYVDVIVPEGLRLFHTREELLGKDASIYYPPEVSELFISNIRECLKKNQTKEVEYHIILHDRRYYYQARIVPVDGDKAFCLIQDIGDRVRRMDELITQRQRAEESDRMKSVFITNISHEIRTPLNAIVGLSELLINEESVEKRQQYMNIIRNNNASLLQIINDILALSRIEAGMSEFHFDETDITALIKDTAELHISDMKQGVRLLTEVPDRNIQVFTDANSVKQILGNLISNAIKYTEKGCITLKMEESEDNLTFSVSDTGCGIPEDKLEIIFNRFEKLKSFVQGTGLGLSICKAFVERLGGKITVTSKTDEGSVFSFSIPYRVASSKNIGSVRELFGNQRKKIMVFETLENDMRYIREILAINYDLVEVTDIEKIVSSFILDQPNLVMVNMEAAGKKDLISKIRAISPSIPIIAMTTTDFYHDQRLALDNGCTDVIDKPFSPTKMKEMVMAFII